MHNIHRAAQTINNFHCYCCAVVTWIHLWIYESGITIVHLSRECFFFGGGGRDQIADPGRGPREPCPSDHKKMFSNAAAYISFFLTPPLSEAPESATGTVECTHENIALWERPENTALWERPENTALWERPENTALWEKPENTALWERPENIALWERPLQNTFYFRIQFFILVPITRLAPQISKTNGVNCCVVVFVAVSLTKVGKSLITGNYSIINALLTHYKPHSMTYRT